MSLVGRVYLLVLLAAAPAFALQLYKDLEQRWAGEAQVEDEALRLVRFASGELDTVLEGARAFLLAVAAHPSVRSGDAAACASYLEGMSMPPPPFRGAFLIDSKGQILCSNRPVEGVISVADRDYFRCAIDTRRFTVGDLTVLRIDGSMSLPVALPLISPGGTLQGVLAMGLSAKALQSSLADKALPPGGIGALDLGKYLRELCGSLASTMLADEPGLKIETHCVPLLVDMDRAVLLGLIASELVTNKLKHAYPPLATGRVLVRLARGVGDTAVLIVRDEGQGWGDALHEGFCLRITGMLTRQLDATLTLDSEGGVTARVEFACPPVVPQAAA